MNNRGFFTLIAGIGAVAVFLSCNLFLPTEANRHPDKDRYHGYALVVEGKIKMRDGDYPEALRLFNEAIVANDSLSEAYFYKGKCVLRLAGVTLQQVWSEVNPPDINTRSVPFLYHPSEGRSILSPITRFSLPQVPGVFADTLIDSVFLQRKRIYDAVSQAIKGLDTIYYNSHRMDGVIRREMYESDYLVEISIRVALGIMDINHNDSLDFNSDERKAFRIMCQDIPSLDNMNFDSLKSISRNPNDINEQLNLIINTVNRADTSYNNFFDELKAGAKKTDKLDTSMAAGVGEMIVNLKDILPFFYYNDYKDNDADWYNTDTTREGLLTASEITHPKVRRVVTNGISHFVRVDRMIWIDWDYDHWIDIDNTGVEHIGEAAHIAAHPELYDLIDTAGSKYHRFRWKGGYTREFIGGDWGVDEEIIDGEDNDQDGLTDEDTRIVADTLDNDGDGWNTEPALLNGDTINPMVWSTLDRPVHLRIAISGTPWDSVAIDRTFIAASSAFQAIPANSKIPRYKGGYSGDFTAGDYGRDEEWFDGVDNDGDGLIDEDIGELLPPISLRGAIIDSLAAIHQRQFP
jgi:hypothetical protein